MWALSRFFCISFILWYFKCLNLIRRRNESKPWYSLTRSFFISSSSATLNPDSYRWEMTWLNRVLNFSPWASEYSSSGSSSPSSEDSSCSCALFLILLLYLSRNFFYLLLDLLGCDVGLVTAATNSSFLCRLLSRRFVCIESFLAFSRSSWNCRSSYFFMFIDIVVFLVGGNFVANFLLILLSTMFVLRVCETWFEIDLFLTMCFFLGCDCMNILGGVGPQERAGLWLILILIFSSLGFALSYTILCWFSLY